MHPCPARSRSARLATSIACFVAILGTSVAGCGNNSIDCSSPDLIRNEATGLCLARCGLQPTEPGYEGCPDGFSCGAMGSFLTCGMQTCSARETCDPITLMCDRGLDAGSTRLDAGSADTGVSTQDSGAAPDTGAPGTDAPSPALDAFASTEDAFSGGTTCSLGLPTSGTRAVMGDVSGFALNTFVVAGEGRVVWAGTSGIQVSDAAMSPPVGIARSEVQDLAITPTHLYWSEGALSAGSLYRLAWSELTTGVPERVAIDPLPIYQIAVSSTALYWTTATGAAVTIRRAALDGSMSLELGACALESAGSISWSRVTRPICRSAP